MQNMNSIMDMPFKNVPMKSDEAEEFGPPPLPPIGAEREPFAAADEPMKDKDGKPHPIDTRSDINPINSVFNTWQNQTTPDGDADQPAPRFPFAGATPPADAKPDTSFETTTEMQEESPLPNSWYTNDEVNSLISSNTTDATSNQLVATKTARSGMTTGEEVYTNHVINPHSLQESATAMSSLKPKAKKKSHQSKSPSPPAPGLADPWFTKFEELKQYKKENGTTDVPQKLQLGSWVNKVRIMYNVCCI